MRASLPTWVVVIKARLAGIFPGANFTEMSPLNIDVELKAILLQISWFSYFVTLACLTLSTPCILIPMVFILLWLVGQ